MVSFFCFRAYAQVGRFSTGLEIGINYSNASEETAPLKKICPVLPCAGIVVNYSMMNHFCLQSGLYYSMKGLKSEGSGNVGGLDAQNAKVTSYQHLLQLPILFGYGFNLGKQNLTFFAGPYFAYGLGGGTKATGIINGQYFEKKSATFGSGKILKRFDSGLNVRAILAVNRICIGISYELGMVNVGNRNIVGAELNYKNRVVALTTGYRF
jgi:hypothetical protein